MMLFPPVLIAIEGQQGINDHEKGEAIKVFHQIKSNGGDVDDDPVNPIGKNFSCGKIGRQKAKRGG